MVKAVIAVYLILNLLLFIIYGVDKRKAIRGSRRVQESTLLIIALIGGGLGGLLGMLTWHHKTRKIYFWLANIGAICLHVALVCALYQLFT